MTRSLSVLQRLLLHYLREMEAHAWVSQPPFTSERCGSSSSVVFQNYKFNFATENSEQLLSVFVTGSVVMTVILNTTFVLWLTAQSVHCTLLQPGCTKIFNGLDLIQFSVANGTAGG